MAERGHQVGRKTTGERREVGRSCREWKRKQGGRGGRRRAEVGEEEGGLEEKSRDRPGRRAKRNALEPPALPPRHQTSDRTTDIQMRTPNKRAWWAARKRQYPWTKREKKEEGKTTQEHRKEEKLEISEKQKQGRKG